MREKICSQETMIARAARIGEWNDSLEAHVAACASCREVMQTVRAMRSLAVAPEGESSMPEATRLWCLALLEQRQLEAARARRALVSMEFATSAVMALGGVGWLAWNWPQIQLQLTAWQTNLWPQLWQAAWFLAGEAPALAARPALLLALLLVAGAILLAQPLLAED